MRDPAGHVRNLSLTTCEETQNSPFVSFNLIKQFHRCYCILSGLHLFICSCEGKFSFTLMSTLALHLPQFFALAVGFVPELRIICSMGVSHI